VTVLNLSLGVQLPKRIDKALLGLAGEYAVASEICRRGCHAQITFGRWKNTDVLAVNLANGKAVLIEVKTKQGDEWPSVKGVKGSNRVQILVDYKGKSLFERPDFYILDEGFWRNYIEKIKGELKEVIETVDRIVLVWPDEYRGVALKPGDIKEYKEQWRIMEGLLS